MKKLKTSITMDYQRGAVCEANICAIREICVQKRARENCVWSNGCFISHADCADDADLPCGLRHWNVPVARMAQMGEKGKDEKIKGDSM